MQNLQIISIRFARVACTLTRTKSVITLNTNCLRNRILNSVFPNFSGRVLSNTVGEDIQTRKYSTNGATSENQSKENEAQSSGKKSSGVKKKGPTPSKKTRFWEKSGDLMEMEEYEKSEIFFPFRGLQKELESAPEDVKKLATLEFCDGQQRLAHALWKTRQEILEVCQYADEDEFIIARMTLQIRNLKLHQKTFTPDVRNRVVLHELIAKRRRHLKWLRQKDFERFLWLLHQLKIQYVPAYTPPKESRRAKMKRIVQEEADARVEEKIGEIEARLNAEKENLEKEKTQVWNQVERDIEQYGLDKDIIRFHVKKNRLKNIELRKGNPVPPVGSFKHVKYLQQQKDIARREERYMKAILWKKKSGDL